MSALNTFSFAGFTLRPATHTDRYMARAWTEADPFHRGKVSHLFWLEQKPGADSYLLSDAKGPVFFFKLMRSGPKSVEFHIQFCPSTEDDAQERTRKGLISGFFWIERVLLMSAVEEATFESDNPELISFCKKRLGFTGDGAMLTKKLAQ